MQVTGAFFTLCVQYFKRGRSISFFFLDLHQEIFLKTFTWRKLHIHFRTWGDSTCSLLLTRDAAREPVDSVVCAHQTTTY